MSRTKGIQQEIAGRAKQVVGEIIGDQDLHEEGKAERNRGENEQQNRPEEPIDLNPFEKLNRLT